MYIYLFIEGEVQYPGKYKNYIPVFLKTMYLLEKNENSRLSYCHA